VEHGARRHALGWMARVLVVEAIAVVIASGSFVYAAQTAMEIKPARPHEMSVVGFVEELPRPCPSARKR
jgi:hypothetical protein